MMLPFTGLLPKILDGTKTMTTRLDAKEWYINAWDRDVEKLHPWWQNPRFHKPDCYRIGVIWWEDCDRAKGQGFTEDDAQRDGFDTLWDFKVTLANHHHMTVDQVNDWVWTQLKWKSNSWSDGPHLPPEDSPLWSTMPELRRLA